MIRSWIWSLNLGKEQPGTEFRIIHEIWFERNTLGECKLREDLEQFKLTPEQVESYRRAGYLAGVDVLSHTQVVEMARRLELLRARIHEHMDRLYEVEADYLSRPEEVVFHFLGAWLVDEWFHDILRIEEAEPFRAASAEQARKQAEPQRPQRPRSRDSEKLAAG